LTSNRFFLNSRNIHKSRAILESEEHHHLKNVARVSQGDQVWLFDESGVSYSARVETIGQSQTMLFLLSRHEKPKKRVEVILAQALVKTKNFELILQKATELGISVFQPVRTARSLMRTEGGVEQKLVRWAKIAREAAKQSGIGYVPDILCPKSLAQVLEDTDAKLKIFLHERSGKLLREFLAPGSQKFMGHPPSSLTVLIGPEGGWTEREETELASHGFVAVNLGQILRAETAAIGCLAMIDHFWNQ